MAAHPPVDRTPYPTPGVERVSDMWCHLRRFVPANRGVKKHRERDNCYRPCGSANVIMFNPVHGTTRACWSLCAGVDQEENTVHARQGSIRYAEPSEVVSTGLVTLAGTVYLYHDVELARINEASHRGGWEEIEREIVVGLSTLLADPRGERLPTIDFDNKASGMKSKVAGRNNHVRFYAVAIPPVPGQSYEWLMTRPIYIGTRVLESRPDLVQQALSASGETVTPTLGKRSQREDDMSTESVSGWNLGPTTAIATVGVPFIFGQDFPDDDTRFDEIRYTVNETIIRALYEHDKLGANVVGIHHVGVLEVVCRRRGYTDVVRMVRIVEALPGVGEGGGAAAVSQDDTNIFAQWGLHNSTLFTPGGLASDTPFELFDGQHFVSGGDPMLSMDGSMLVAHAWSHGVPTHRRLLLRPNILGITPREMAASWRGETCKLECCMAPAEAPTDVEILGMMGINNAELARTGQVRTYQALVDESDEAQREEMEADRAQVDVRGVDSAAAKPASATFDTMCSRAPGDEKRSIKQTGHGYCKTCKHLVRTKIAHFCARCNKETEPDLTHDINWSDALKSSPPSLQGSCGTCNRVVDINLRHVDELGHGVTAERSVSGELSYNPHVVVGSDSKRCCRCLQKHGQLLWLSCGCYIGVGSDNGTHVECFSNFIRAAFEASPMQIIQEDGIFIFACPSGRHENCKEGDVKIFRLASSDFYDIIKLHFEMLAIDLATAEVLPTPGNSEETLLHARTVNGKEYELRSANHTIKMKDKELKAKDEQIADLERRLLEAQSSITQLKKQLEQARAPTGKATPKAAPTPVSVLPLKAPTGVEKSPTSSIASTTPDSALSSSQGIF